jgi:hypothetical protein
MGMPLTALRSPAQGPAMPTRLQTLRRLLRTARGGGDCGLGSSTNVTDVARAAPRSKHEHETSTTPSAPTSERRAARPGHEGRYPAQLVYSKRKGSRTTSTKPTPGSEPPEEGGTPQGYTLLLYSLR